MADKQYFWLKLPKDFFKKHYIEILLSKDDGKNLVLFYIWMLTESIDHEGRLRYSDKKPYDAALLAEVAHYDEQFVERALELFDELELATVESDGTVFMPKSLKMIGKESESAQRVREYRERKRKGQDEPEEKRNNETECNNDVTESNGKIIAKQKEDRSEEAMEVIDEWNRLQEFGIKPVVKLDKTSKRYKSLISRLNQYGKEDIKKAIEKVRNSDFLQGRNSRSWQITFDWFVLPNNFPKVLEGNYDNNGNQSSGNARIDKIQNRVNEVDNW